MADSVFDNETVFTLTQTMQLVGLVPSLFIMASLLTLLRSNNQTIIPIFYFLSLACGFALPLLDLYPIAAKNIWLHGGLLMGESLLVAFGFLLICQFFMRKIPPFSYWLVLAIPIIGGGTILYADMIQLTEACKQESCPDVNSVKSLYHIISSSFMFLLLLVYFSRINNIRSNATDKKHKYWLIISLILLHLSLLFIDLIKVSSHINMAQAQLAEAILRLTFIYLVLTSLLRVFYPSLAHEIMVKAHNPTYNSELDSHHVEKLNELINNEKIYREMRLNRASLAQKLNIGEHHLSRIINYNFNMNFNELINKHRIDEAKSRLLNEPNMQITTIAFEIGFNSIASFNRVFKEKTNLSPTEFRAKEKNILHQNNSNTK
jgi:AraC-like DNA-binding protein